MERYIGVSQARAWFADVLNTGAYASDRVVIHRRGQELGAFVGVADLSFLRRHKPRSRFPEPTPRRAPPDPLENELWWREGQLEWKEKCERRGGATEPEINEQFGEERDFLRRLRDWLGPPRD